MSDQEFTLRIIVMSVAVVLFLAGATLKAIRPQTEGTPMALIAAGFLLMLIASDTES